MVNPFQTKGAKGLKLHQRSIEGPKAFGGGWSSALEIAPSSQSLQTCASAALEQRIFPAGPSVPAKPKEMVIDRGHIIRGTQNRPVW